MHRNSKITPEYKKRVKRLKQIVRGNYQVLADRTGKSIDTVKSVMSFKFRNDNIVEAAEKLAIELNECIN